MYHTDTIKCILTVLNSWKVHVCLQILFLISFGTVLNDSTLTMRGSLNLESPEVIQITSNFFLQLRMVGVLIGVKSNDVRGSLSDASAEKDRWGNRPVAPPLPHVSVQVL